MLLLNVIRKTALWPVLLSLLLAACATPSPISAVVCPAIPAPPPLTQPIPSRPYSESAKTDIETWRQKLMGTQTTPAP